MEIVRHARPLVDEVRSWARVCVINGPRQCGKSTLLRAVHATTGGDLVSLDDPPLRSAAKDDPIGFLQALSRPAFIDEIQLGGDDLVRAIKLAVDRAPDRGSFIVAGSTRFLTVASISESLAGRAGFVDLWPLSQGEIAGRQPERFLDAAFLEPDQFATSPSDVGEPRRDTIERICAGGFPDVVLTPNRRARRGWIDSYVRTVAQRDVAMVTGIRGADQLQRLTRVLAAQTASELKAAEAARRLGADVDTVRSYLNLLETAYVFHRLPAWSRNLTAKAVRSPKLHMVDVGLAAQLLDLGVDRLLRPGEVALGALLETFVAGELARQRTWSEVPHDLSHFRDRDGSEVDIVAERHSGEIIGIEVKAAHSVNQADARGLRVLRDRLGGAFIHGFVIHLGERPLPLGDRLTALPIKALWSI